MSGQGLSVTLLIPMGKILLTACFAGSLIQAMRGESSLSLCFEKLVIGLLGLTFYMQANIQFEAFSTSLAASISGLSHQEDLKSFIFESLKKASEEKTASGGSSVFNLPAYIEQAWRTGVWGILNAVIDLIFLLVSNILILSKEVLTTLLLLLFPLAAGLYPAFPRLMGNLCFYRLELALWLPILSLVEVTSVLVGKKYVTVSGSLGLYVTVVEIIVVILILSIPAITHRFLAGAFSGDFESQSGLIGSLKKLGAVSKIIRERDKS